MAIENLRDEVEQQMKETKERMNHLRNLAPWWYSGSNCLAAFMWINFACLSWWALSDKIPEGVGGIPTGIAMLLFFLVAMGASVQGAGKR